MRYIAVLLLTLPLVAQDSASVDGVVVNSVTGMGIAGAEVVLRLKGSFTSYEATTGEDGVFHIGGVQPGEHLTLCDKAGFSMKTGVGRSITVAAGDSAKLRLELQPPATLWGRVFGPDGKPIAGVKVERLLGPDGPNVSTGPDGSYAFENVPPGAYVVRAFPKLDAKPMREAAREEIVPTYFPSASDRAGASAVTVQPGVDQGGFDIHLQSATRYRVRGVVVDTDGKPVAEASVELLPRTDLPPRKNGFVTVSSPKSFVLSLPQPPASVEHAGPVRTSEGGVFEFSSVAAGDAMVIASQSVVGTTDLIEGAEAITIGGRGVEDMRVQLSLPFRMPGKFEYSDGSPVVNLKGRVMLEPDAGWFGVSASTTSDGAFLLDNVVEGTYRIRPTVADIGNYFVSSMMLGSADVTGQVAHLLPGSPEIRIVLKPGGSVRGTVAVNGTVTVLLWPVDFSSGDYGGSAVVGAGGGFEFKGLAPGEYYVASVPQFDIVEAVAGARVVALQPGATRVRVDGDASVSVQLTALPTAP